MPDELESRSPEDATEGGPRVREADDAAREAAAESAAASQKQAMQRAQKEEGQARRNDAGFAKAFVHFLQGRDDDEYLELLIGLLERNIPSSVLLAVVSLLDDEAASVFRSTIEIEESRVQELATGIETRFAALPPSLPDPARLRTWVLLLSLSVERLDAEMRERLKRENRDADMWLRDAIQATLLRFILAPTPQHRVDVAAFSLSIDEELARCPLPPAIDGPAR